jgi:hypothetical protein
MGLRWDADVAWIGSPLERRRGFAQRNERTMMIGIAVRRAFHVKAEGWRHLQAWLMGLTLLAAGAWLPSRVLAAGASPAPQAVDIMDPATDPSYFLPDQVVVRFKKEAAAKLHMARLTTFGLMHNDLTRDFTALGLKPLNKHMNGVTPFVSGDDKAQRIVRRDAELARSLDARMPLDAKTLRMAEQALIDGDLDCGPVGMFYVRLDGGIDPRQASRELMARGDVEYAHPSRIYRPSAAPDDPLYWRMWNLHRLNMDYVWDAIDATTETQVKVAVIDTGVRVSHDELESRTESPKDVYIFNGDVYADSDPDNDDPDGHGTACAGIIASIRNNASLLAGIAPVTIIPISGAIEGDPGEWGIVNYEDGVEWAVDHGADVISMSFGGYALAPTSSEIDAANYAVEYGVLGVAAAGNDDLNLADNMYPAAMDQYMSVGAIDQFDNRVSTAFWWWGSNWGSTVEICAPGQGSVNNPLDDSIITLSNETDDGYINYFNGTSAATPHVAACAALVKYKNPDLDGKTIRSILDQTALDQIGYAGEDTPGKDKFYGFGLVNPAFAVDMASSGSEVLDLWEENDVRAEAVNITSINGQWLSDLNEGAKPLQEDDDWYRFSTPDEDITARILIKHDGQPGSIAASLHGVSGNTLEYSESGAGFELIERRLFTASNYYLKVYGTDSWRAYDIHLLFKTDQQADIQKGEWLLYQ